MLNKQSTCFFPVAGGAAEDNPQIDWKISLRASHSGRRRSQNFLPRLILTLMLCLMVLALTMCGLHPQASKEARQARPRNQPVPTWPAEPKKLFKQQNL